jgi:hypothetical protein
MPRALSIRVMTTSEARAYYDDKINEALKIIRPGARSAECREDIDTWLIESDYEFGQKRATSYWRTKPAKRSARRLAEVLRRVEHVLNDERLDAEILLSFPRDDIKAWRRRCEELAAAPSQKAPKRLEAEKKRRAVIAALNLISRYDGSPVSAKAGSKFCRLAAVMYGETSVDLHNQCRAALRKKRGQT